MTAKHIANNFITRVKTKPKKIQESSAVVTWRGTIAVAITAL